MVVRFPNGQAVQYNNAHYVTRRSEYSDLYQFENNKSWIAQVPNDCIIEVVPACRVFNAVDALPMELSKELKATRRRLESVEGQMRILARAIAQGRY